MKYRFLFLAKSIFIFNVFVLKQNRFKKKNTRLFELLRAMSNQLGKTNSKNKAKMKYIKTKKQQIFNQFYFSCTENIDEIIHDRNVSETKVNKKQ